MTSLTTSKNVRDSAALSRTGIYSTLGNLLSDISSIESDNIVNQENFHQDTAQAFASSKSGRVYFETENAVITYENDLSSIEHIHIRCKPASTFDRAIHFNLSEAVLGIYPIYSKIKNPTEEEYVLVRGIDPLRAAGSSRRIKVGDWLVAINGISLTSKNFNRILSKLNVSKTLRLTIRHPINYRSKFSLSEKFNVKPTPTITSTTLEQLTHDAADIDFLHCAMYYGRQKQTTENDEEETKAFELLYQQPTQKDIFLAANGLFPTLIMLTKDMNNNDSNNLRSVTINACEQELNVCITSDTNDYYLVIIYPPLNISRHILEYITKNVSRLLQFLFGSIHQAFFPLNQNDESVLTTSSAVKHFFNLLFYRLYNMSSPNVSPILKHCRLSDELYIDQFEGIPKLLTLTDVQLTNVDSILNSLESQELNECSNEINRFRRPSYVYGCVLFFQSLLVTSHLSKTITLDIYRFLIHYCHLKMRELRPRTTELLIYKEIFLTGTHSFLIVFSLAEFTLAVVVQTHDSQSSPDHVLINQIQFILEEIERAQLTSQIRQSFVNNISPWIISYPSNFVKKQLKRTISLPLLSAFTSSTTNVETSDTIRNVPVVTEEHLNQRESSIDTRAKQLVSQKSGQDELYKNRRQSSSSTLSLENQTNFAITDKMPFKLHPGENSTIFYYLDFQSFHGLLITPYITLQKSSMTDKQLFETFQETCLNIRLKHFKRTKTTTTSVVDKSLFNTKQKPVYNEVGYLHVLPHLDSKETTSKKNLPALNFWIVGKQCVQESFVHEFFVCYHDSIDQNIQELAFSIGLAA
ncbi:unnamed protein product [Didymodactylos carnosus]|uniref:Inturned planar cell polarity effector homolog n=1 Tax=Didymodactylos carnosus TaxID=1234261 RepID=A0A813YJ75_9BILA|nr:unnamed protein product [Didymodactylos carnosus]CAF3670474.1 unnamed protein product [Didymodactylos carnosus]